MSSNSGTSSSSTPPPQDSSSTSSSPATERGDDQAPGNWRDSPNTQNKNLKKGISQAAGNRFRDLPDWPEEFTDNLEDTEVPAPANTSQDSDAERPTKVASMKHRIYTHFQMDRNCEICKRTKITRAPCRRRIGDSVPRAETSMTW